MALLTDASWIHRRKETVEIIDSHWVRRQTAIDFSVPSDLLPSLPESFLKNLSARFLIPVTLLPKLPPTLMRFDFAEGNGTPLTLPTLRQSHLAAYAALQWTALRCILTDPNQFQYLLPLSLRRELLFIASAAPGDAVATARTVASGAAPEPEPPLRDVDVQLADEELLEWSRSLSGRENLLATAAAEYPVSSDERQNVLAATEAFRYLLDLVARNTLVMAEISGGSAGRKVVKLAYDEHILQSRPRTSGRGAARLSSSLGWRPHPIVLVMPYAKASTYHIEVAAPASLEINDSRLLIARDEDATSQCIAGERAEPRHGSRIHRYVRRATDLADVVLHVELRADRLGFVAGAWAAALSVAALLTGMAAFPTAVLRSTVPVTGFLFLFPALFVTLAARTDRGELAARILRNARRTLLTNGTIAVLAAVPLVLSAGPKAEPTFLLRTYWIALAVAAAISVVALALARVLPRPSPDACPEWIPHPERRLEKWLSRTEGLPGRVALRGLRIELSGPAVEATDVARFGKAHTWRGVDFGIRPLLWKWGPAPAERYFGRTRGPRAIRLANHYDGRSLLQSLPDATRGGLELDPAGAHALARTLARLLEHLDGAVELKVTWRRMPLDVAVEMRRAVVTRTVAEGALRHSQRYRLPSKTDESQAPR